MPKKLIPIIFSLVLALTLSGCNAVGTNKPAALQITSTPEASVFLDGKHVGKSPFFSDQLKSKEYTVKLTSGEASYVEKVTLSEGTLTVINHELNNNFLAQAGEVLWLNSQDKGIFIISMPNEATVSLDGQLVGKTPTKIENIAEGEHKISISKQGYVEREFAVKTSPKYQVVANVTLASEIAKGIVTPKEVPAQIKMGEVENTPQGFLRVRKEPTTSSSEIGRVDEGTKFEIVQEATDWTEVKFEGKQGWVSSVYIKEI